MARRYVIRQDAAPVAPISGIDYRTALNEEQYAAVSSEPGPALVIAGAGSGKTRTLTYRVAWLLDHGTDPWNILLLTFTNKAAREMTERVRSLIPLDPPVERHVPFHCQPHPAPACGIPGIYAGFYNHGLRRPQIHD